MTDQVLATLTASPARRMFGLGCLLLLGGMLIFLGFTRSFDAFGWQLFLLAFGALSLAMAEKMRRATTGKLILTPEGLFDGDGRSVALIDDISRVNRGTFAAKPTNGFMLELRRSDGRVWAPGIWWRLGRRAGVGGVTTPAETRAMADMIQALLRQRDASDADAI